jgi:hypothetical protein
MKFLVTTIAALALLLATVAAASAYTIPSSRNLVVVTTPDNQVALSFFAPANDKQCTADAGAFATVMTQRYGFHGIANYEPDQRADSVHVADWPQNPQETVMIYGLRGQSVNEAIAIAQGLQNDGAWIIWYV